MHRDVLGCVLLLWKEVVHKFHLAQQMGKCLIQFFVGSTPNITNLFYPFLSIFVSNDSNNSSDSLGLLQNSIRSKNSAFISIVYAFGGVKERVQKTSKAMHGITRKQTYVLWSKHGTSKWVMVIHPMMGVPMTLWMNVWIPITVRGWWPSPNLRNHPKF